MLLLSHLREVVDFSRIMRKRRTRRASETASEVIDRPFQPLCLPSTTASVSDGVLIRCRPKLALLDDYERRTRAQSVDVCALRKYIDSDERSDQGLNEASMIPHARVSFYGSECELVDENTQLDDSFDNTVMNTLNVLDRTLAREIGEVFEDVQAEMSSSTDDNSSPLISLRSELSYRSEGEHMDIFGYTFESLDDEIPIEMRRGLDSDSESGDGQGIGGTVDYFAENGADTVRLRKRESGKNDAVEAGFEGGDNRRQSRLSAVSRNTSAHRLSFSNSQFSPADYMNGSGAKHSVSNEYATPTAVVGPRKSRTGIVLSQSNYEIGSTEREEHRRSMQQINGLFGSGYSTNPSGGGGHLSGNGSGGDMPITHLVPPTPQSSQHHHPAYSNNGGGGSGRNTPQMHRRSMQTMQMQQPLAHSTPINKVAVAPQPHRPSHRSHRDSGERERASNSYTESRRNSSMHGAVVVPTYHAYKNDSYFTQEVIVDEPPSPTTKDRRVASLEQRVRELEMMQQGSPVTSTRVPQTHVVIASNSPQAAIQQQLMAKEVVDKELEVERLQTQLRKTFTRMEMQQVQYDDEVRQFKKDNATAKEELQRVKNRLMTLEKECDMYKERASAMDASNGESLQRAMDKIAQQEREIARLRRELENTTVLKEELSRVKEELAYLEVQNETLNSTLDNKEDKLKELESSMITMRLEQTLYQQSCSSGSTPLADECQSLADVHRPFGSGELRNGGKPYTKAHSTLGAPLSPASLPKNVSNGLAKSLSNYHLNETSGKGDHLTPAMSQMMRQSEKHVMDCRLLVRCLKESAEAAAKGETPDISRLLGIRTDSMSESEAEVLAADSTAMTMGTAEKHMRRQQDALHKLERDLDAVRGAIQSVYKQRLRSEVARSAGDEEACRVQ